MKFIKKFLIALMIIALTASISFFIGKTLIKKYLTQTPEINSSNKNEITI